ncbi:MAG: hypothetical protein KAV87_18285 [Desulfobacteraceae bacterium]|nr:hypothetical protein [Desulfobacteraceae bacterium]
MDYNHYRPHSNLDYMARTAFAAMCLEHSYGTFCLTQDREIKREILSQQLLQKTGSRSRLP